MIKTMTCAEMGGPCEHAMTGTKEELLAQGTEHVNSTMDEAHMKIAGGMKTMSPEDQKAWGDKFEADFAAKPENM